MIAEHVVDLSRFQFAATALYHFLFVPLTLGMAFILAIIVMYDAMGVRRETGIQAQVLNDMMKIFEDMGRSEISPHDKLKEFVGHTPLQVLMGALLGIFCGVIIYAFVI